MDERVYSLCIMHSALYSYDVDLVWHNIISTILLFGQTQYDLCVFSPQEADVEHHEIRPLLKSRSFTPSLHLLPVNTEFFKVLIRKAFSLCYLECQYLSKLISRPLLS